MQIAPAVIRHDLDSKLNRVWNQRHIRVGDLWDFYTKYPCIPRLRDKTVLMREIDDILMDVECAQPGFALADDLDSAGGDFAGLTLPLKDDCSVVTDETYFVAPHVASAQRICEESAVRPSEPTTETRTSDTSLVGLSNTTVTTVQSPVTVSPSVVHRARHEDRHQVDASEPEAIADRLSAVIEEVIRHIVSAQGAENVSIVIEVCAESSDGLSELVARTVRESSKVLGFDKSVFEGVEW